jgi:hypothetical protein
MHVFLSFVNSLDLERGQVDIKAASLNRELEEIIFMEPPEGSNITHSKVIRLERSLYGLCQSSSCSNQSFDKWMKVGRLHSTQADTCLYVYNRTRSPCLFPYISMTSSLHTPALDAFKKRLNAQFKCTDNGPVNYFLRFNVIRDRQAKRLGGLTLWREPDISLQCSCPLQKRNTRPLQMQPHRRPVTLGSRFHGSSMQTQLAGYLDNGERDVTRLVSISGDVFDRMTIRFKSTSRLNQVC